MLGTEIKELFSFVSTIIDSGLPYPNHFTSEELFGVNYTFEPESYSSFFVECWNFPFLMLFLSTILKTNDGRLNEGPVEMKEAVVSNEALCRAG